MHESKKWKWSCSVVWDSSRPPAAYQAPPPMGFSRQEYWSGLPLPSLNPSFKTEFILSTFFSPLFTAETGLLILIFESTLCKIKQFQLANWWSLANSVQISRTMFKHSAPARTLTRTHTLPGALYQTLQGWEPELERPKPQTGLFACGIPGTQTYRCYNIDTACP